MDKYFIICIIIFFISLYCLILQNKNLVVNLLLIELAFLSINLMLILNSWAFNEIKSQILIIYILTLTAIETAFGLALFILYYNKFNNIETKNFYNLKF
jgi:NADH-quinone oxidoreductase subunit K|nr:NADH dehydrogenase subunit 4L [Actinophrys sol]